MNGPSQHTNGANGHAVHAPAPAQAPASTPSDASFNKGYVEGMRRACALLMGPLNATLTEEQRLKLGVHYDAVEYVIHEKEKETK